jgi:hypothetical protein
MANKYMNMFLSETLKIFSQIGIFGLKTNHLATLGEAVRRGSHKVDIESICFAVGNSEVGTRT